MAHHLAGLIGLQTSDEMPIQGRQIGQCRLLGDGLLHPAFAKAHLAQGRRLANQRRGMALAHRQQAGSLGKGETQGLQPLAKRQAFAGPGMVQMKV